MLSSRRPYRRADVRYEALARKIEAHAPFLADQGVIVLKKLGAKRFWYLRFQLPADATGHRRHRSLYVGRESDEELVARVRTLLEHCRAPQRRLQELTACVQFAVMLCRTVLSSMRTMSHHI